MIPVVRGWRLLDVGCGVGSAACAIAQRGDLEVVGVDIDPAQIAAAKATMSRSNLQFLAMDATALKFGDAVFWHRCLLDGHASHWALGAGSGRNGPRLASRQLPELCRLDIPALAVARRAADVFSLEKRLRVICRASRPGQGFTTTAAESISMAFIGRLPSDDRTPLGLPEKLDWQTPPGNRSERAGRRALLRSAKLIPFPQTSQNHR